MKRVLLISLILLTFQSYAQDRITGATYATRSEVISQNGMVATSHPLATQIGIDILKHGGNAIDAAIAANAALGLMEPTGSGIGGDLFAIIWSAKDKKLYGLNASGRSPEKLTLQYFKDKKMTKIPSFGPLPVSIPGCVDGWYEMHNKFGTLKMEQILAPAISYARNGFPVTELIGYYLTASSRRFKEYPNFADTYMPNDKPLTKGSVFKNPYLADTYSKIAKGGKDAFYKGEIAKIIANFLFFKREVL